MRTAPTLQTGTAGRVANSVACVAPQGRTAALVHGMRGLWWWTCCEGAVLQQPHSPGRLHHAAEMADGSAAKLIARRGFRLGCGRLKFAAALRKDLEPMMRCDRAEFYERVEQKRCCGALGIDN